MGLWETGGVEGFPDGGLVGVRGLSWGWTADGRELGGCVCHFGAFCAWFLFDGCV